MNNTFNLAYLGVEWKPGRLNALQLKGAKHLIIFFVQKAFIKSLRKVSLSGHYALRPGEDGKMKQKLISAKTVEELHELHQKGELEGWSPDLAAEVYHAGPGIGSHGLMDMLKSPLTYKTRRERPREVTQAMELGTAIHTAVLEPERFDELNAVWALSVDRRTKEGKEKWAAFGKANVGRKIWDAEDAELIKGVAARARSHKRFRKMLEEGMTEASFFATTGKVTCRVRPDLYLPEKGIVVDLKTVQDARAEPFAKDIAFRLYHLQAAYYLDVLRSAGFKAETFIFAVVEKEPPYEMALYHLNPRSLEIGRKLYGEALALHECCVAEDLWPGMPEDFVEIDLPEWHLRRLEQ